MYLEINPHLFIMDTSDWRKMNLKEYMDFTGITQKKISDETGLHINTIRNLIYSKVAPETSTIIKLEKFTNGLVTYYDWINNKEG